MGLPRRKRAPGDLEKGAIGQTPQLDPVSVPSAEGTYFPPGVLAPQLRALPGGGAGDHDLEGVGEEWKVG